MVCDNPATWVRRNAMMMARISYTPVPFWLDIPLYEWRVWLSDAKANAEAQKEARERAAAEAKAKRGK